MKKYNIPIIILILIIVVSILSFLNGYLQELKQAEINRLDFQNGAMRISLEDKDKEIKKLKEEKIADLLVIEYAKEEITKQVEYIEFMQNLCDANNLTYPYYLMGE